MWALREYDIECKGIRKSSRRLLSQLVQSRYLRSYLSSFEFCANLVYKILLFYIILEVTVIIKLETWFSLMPLIST